MTEGTKKLVLGLAVGAAIGVLAGYGIGARQVASSGRAKTFGRLVTVGQTPKSGQLISLEQTVAELGVVDQGTTVVWAFPYKNIGSQMLKIGEVTSTCGCTTSEPSPREVKPGGSGLLKVTLMTGNFNGPITKKLILRSNDPALPAVELVLKANIRALFVLEPRMLQFGDVERGKTATKELLIRPASKHEVEIEKVTTKIPGLAVEVLPKNPADRGAVRVVFKVEANQSYGPFNHAVRVEMKRPFGGSAAARPLELIIHALGTVAGPFRVKPESVFLGQVKPGERFQPQKLVLTSRNGTPVEVRSVDTGFEGLKAEVKAVKPGLEYELGLSNITALPTGLFHRTVRVMTTASEVPLEIRVVGVVLKPM